MTGTTVVTILAIVAGPVLAVQVQKILERMREGRQRRLAIFRTLMATRARALSLEHVQALNMIDIEFHGKKKRDRTVVDAWRQYRDYLNNGPRDYESETFQSRFAAWSSQIEEHLTNLLFAMSRCLGYSFDKVELKRGAYVPQGHEDLEFEQNLLRRTTLEILMGKRSLPVRVEEERDPVLKGIESGKGRFFSSPPQSG